MNSGVDFQKEVFRMNTAAHSAQPELTKSERKALEDSSFEDDGGEAW